jgi:aminoglycoside phosphotransferase (APT) family kinase protein
MNPWEQKIFLTENQIREILLEQFDLHVESLELLGAGFDNTAYLVNQSLVFRFPRRQEGLSCIENEINLLPYISQRISFPCTAPTFIGKSSELFPHPFAGYPLVIGIPLCDFQTPLVSSPRIAQILGTWLKQLHSLPVKNEHYNIIQGPQDWRLDIAHHQKYKGAYLEKYGSIYHTAGFDIQQLTAIINNFHNLFVPDDRTHVYLHGDLYSKHIIVHEDGMPAGFIDWGDMHIGHPGIDLSMGIMIFDNPTLNTFLQAYGMADENMIKIAAFRAFCHAFASLPYCVETQENSLMPWAQAALQNAVNIVS